MQDRRVRTMEGSRVHAVVVLNYKGKKDTLECLSGLMALHEQDCDAVRVVLVDNGSGDGVIADAVELWPDIRWVQLPENQGFAGGMNAGLRSFDDSMPDTLTVLNNDTIVEAATIVHLGRLAIERQAAVSPTILYFNDGDEPWFAGGTLDPETFQPRHMSSAEVSAHDSVRPEDPEVRSVEVLAGCCITAPSVVWQSVGLFDERYFLNFEDSDWSLRARARAVPLFVAKDAVIRHRVSASFRNEYSFLGHYYYTRNGLLFRKSKGAPRKASFKFLRRNVIPAVVQAARNGRLGDGMRLGVLTIGAVLNHAVGRYGKAPAWAHLASRRRTSGST